MESFKFRVMMDYERDVFRDIEITPAHTFFDLHQIILQAFEFSGEEMASFYMSNDNWDKGEEIGLMEMNFGGEEIKAMHNTLIGDRISRPHQKVLYVYDFLRLWIFYLELMEINEVQAGNKYPGISLAFGKAPKEDSKGVDPVISGEEDPDIFNDSFEDENDDDPFSDFENFADPDDFR